MPPSSSVTKRDLDNLVAQLPEPFIIVGDLNAHNHVWDPQSVINGKGKLIEKVISDHDLCLWNDNSPTYIHPATGSMSIIDLCLCSANLFLDFNFDFNFEVHDDLCGSDHFPVFLHPSQQRGNDNVQRWKLNQADWPEFSRLCAMELTPDTMSAVDNDMDILTSSLKFICECTIPKSSASPRKLNKPWWNEECQIAVNARKRALRIFKKRPTQANLNHFRQQFARARKVIRDSMRNSWKDYVSKLNNRTPSNKVWDMIRKIKGTNSSGGVKHLVKDGNILTDVRDIGNALAETISHNSSLDHYSPTFQRHKIKSERNHLKFDSDNSENYNKLFIRRELTDALQASHDTAVGPDEIHYQIIKHLPDISLEALLQTFNNIWTTGNFPDIWHQATIIPIPKPGKDSTNPSNYRPIALTSCLCKTMERMINRRLMWYLEHNSILNGIQCGFRKSKCTIDQLIRLESAVREAFIRREHIVAVYFDLEKAYDTTWKYGIMKDLFEAGLRGRLPIFIDQFLHNRKFSIRIGSTLSDAHDQEEGVPQGSIISVTCFIMKINSITRCIRAGMSGSLYVDDFLLCYSSKSMGTIEMELQLSLNKLQDWADENGFKFSRSKTVCMHFCNLRNIHPEPQLVLNGAILPLVDEYKFLGVVFDKKLSFIPHIKYIKSKCLKSLNLLRTVSRFDWGGDRVVLLRLYRSIIRSKLDYGCIVYGSARMSYITQLDTIHHQGLRICMGAFRTSPAESLYVEADEESLFRRREKLTLQYALRIKAHPNNPAYADTFRPKCVHKFQQRPTAIRPFGLRVQTLVQNCNINLDSIATCNFYDIPLWELQVPVIRYDLRGKKKADTHALEYYEMFSRLQAELSDHKFIYTDGSAAGDRVACAAVYRGQTSMERLPDKASIYTAELRAISLALDFIEHSRHCKFAICSDSLSALQGIQSLKVDNTMVSHIVTRYLDLLQSNTIIFIWLPSHVGIRGNELADSAANSALDCDLTNIEIPYTDLRCGIRTYIRDQWQLFWDDQINNKLHFVKPTIGPTVCRPTRREDLCLCRVRIGHTYLTHKHLLHGEPAPICLMCRDVITVKHLLLDCVEFSHIRDNLFSEDTLLDLFKNVPPDVIISFLRQAGLLYSL